MPKKDSTKKIPLDYLPIGRHMIGEKRNYNLDEYDLYAVGTIEYEQEKSRFQARIGFQDSHGTETIFFNSYHQNFNDAQSAINFVKEGKESGKLYNIFGETTDVHTSPSFPGPIIEVLALIYSFNH